MGNKEVDRQKFMINIFSSDIPTFDELLSEARNMCPGGYDVEALDCYIQHYNQQANRTKSANDYYKVRTAIELKTLLNKKQVEFNRSLLMEN